MHSPDVEIACSLAVARLERASEPEEIEREFAILREAADAGYAPAQYAYAYWLDIIKADSLGGIPFLIQAARRGHADARHELCRRYTGQKRVRAFVRERLSSEEIARLGLTEGNWLTWFLTPNENGNTPFALLIGLLFIGGVFVYMLVLLAGWYELWQAAENTGVEAFIMLSIYVGVFLFCLCGLVAMLLEWRKAGSAAYHPLAFIVLSLFISYLATVLLAWGWYGFCCASREVEYWWRPAVICTALGVLVAVYLLRVFVEGARLLSRRGR